ncbi:MAG: pyridoxamine 5'-phosphate oxidase family protein [Pseudomonadota bacterium]
MSDTNDLVAFLADAWRHLAEGVADADAPARFPTFATISPDGVPEARTVALRHADQNVALVEVHTDIDTNKVRALRKAPIAALHVWVPRARLQIRMTAEVDIRTGPGVEAEWNKVPSGSRVSYGTDPVPGTPIGHVYDYAKPVVRDRFAVLRCLLTDIDLVHLDDQHRRAAYQRADDWVGTWVAP